MLPEGDEAALFRARERPESATPIPRPRPAAHRPAPGTPIPAPRGSFRDAATDPALPAPNRAAPPPPRAPGTRHGLILLAGSSVPVLGGVLVAPLLPTIAQEFAAVPGVAVLVPLLVGITGLAIALVAPFAGALTDRFGRTRVLVAALVLVAVAGTAPVYLSGLPAILASRAVLGIAEAGVFTCCTTLIGDYFPGERRDRWLGWQVVATSLSATAFFVLGGALGEFGWRVPFWAYAGVLLLVPAALSLPEPATAPPRVGRRRVPWGVLVLPAVLTFLTATLFYVVPTQLSFVLDELGVRAPQALGVITGGAALATAIGGFFVGNLDARRLWLLLPVECALTAAGLLMLGTAGPSLVLVAVGAVLASMGGGMLVATLLIGTMRVLDVGVRGLGTGAWSSGFFLGQFAGPVFVGVVAAGEPGGLQRAVTVLGAGGAVLVLVTIVLGLVPAIRQAAERTGPAA